MKKLEKELKAFANARRLKILELLSKRGSATVGQVSRAIKLSFKSTSRHLNLLFAANLVDRQQIRLEMHYSVSQNKRKTIKTILNII